MLEGLSATSKRPPAGLEQSKAFFSQAVNLIKAKNYPPAEQLLKRILKIMPDHGSSYQLLSVIASEQGDLEQALKLIHAAIKYQSHQVEFYYNRAMIYQRLKKPKQAILDLAHVIAIKPSYYPALLALGRVFHSLKNYDKAIFFL